MLNKYINEDIIFVGVVGSTKRNEKKKIKELLIKKKEKYKSKMIIVVSGGAKGIDTDTEIVCKQIGIPYLIFPPILEEYNSKGRNIYFERNYKIAEISNDMIAFPLGYNDGTKNTIRYFKELGKEKNLEIF